MLEQVPVAEDSRSVMNKTKEMKVLQSLENEITGLQNKQQTLTSQLNENSMVKQEMDLLNSDSKVYKLVLELLIIREELFGDWRKKCQIQ